VLSESNEYCDAIGNVVSVTVTNFQILVAGLKCPNDDMEDHSLERMELIESKQTRRDVTRELFLVPGTPRELSWAPGTPSFTLSLMQLRFTPRLASTIIYPQHMY